MWEVYAALIAPLLVVFLILLITAALIEALLVAINEIRQAL